MWRLFGATATLFVLGVYAGFVLPVPNTISTVQGESTHTYPYLSAVSYTKLPATNSVPTVAASIIENPAALDARFAGMLLHVRWLLERRGGTAVETELNRLDKQILSVMDDVSDDINDLREDIDEAGGLPSGFVVDNTGTVTVGVWQGTPILDAYINDVLTIGTGSSFANDVVTPNSLLSSGQVDEYCLTYEGTGTTFEWEMCGGGTGLTSTDIDTSSEIAAIVGDETGSGALVFATSPTFSGTAVFSNTGIQVGSSVPFSDAVGSLTLQNIDIVDATTEGTIEGAIDTLASLTSASALVTVGTITSGTWNGTAIADAYITKSGNWTGTFDGFEGAAFALDSDIGTTIQAHNANTSILGNTISATELATADFGDFSCNGASCALDTSFLTVTNIDTSAELAAILTDETGTGPVVFSVSPTFTGTVNAAAATLSSTLTLSGTAANIALGSNWLSGDGGDEGIYIASDGRVGVGTSSPYAAYQMTLEDSSTDFSRFGLSISVEGDGAAGGSRYGGLDSYATSKSGNSTNLAYLYGLGGGSIHRGTGIVSDAWGAYTFTGNNSSGSITNMYGYDAQMSNDSAAGTITNLKLFNTSDISNTGTITNTYGLYLGDLTAGTQTNQAYSVYASDANTRNYFAGNVGIGSTSPSSKLSVSGTSQFTEQVRIGSTFIGNVGARNEKLVVSNYLVDPSISVFTARSRSVVGFTAENAAKYNIGVFAGASVHEANTADWTTLGYPQLVGVSARVDAESGSSGTIERAAGVYSVASAAADSATLKQVAFFQGDAAGTSMTHLAGVYLTGLAHGTYNTGLYLGIAQDALTPTANYGIYDVTGYNSYLSGGLGIGTTTPNQKLTVQGNINLSSETGAIYFDDTKYLYASSTNDSITFGENAGATFTNGTSNNVALGFEAGRFASSSAADDSIYIGNQAGYNNAGWSNIFLGRAAGYNASGWGSNFFAGDHAGYNSAGNDNVFIGQSAGRNNLGESGVFIGSSAGINNTGLYNNNFFGYSAGYNNSGDENNAFGQNAGYNNSGSEVNMFGLGAGYNNSGSYNNFLGHFAGYSNTGNFNEMIGYQTGQNLRSTSSVAVGAEALFGSGGTYSSLNNVALGYRAGYASANGSGNNILVGYRAADNLTTGNNNIIIGYDIDNITATADNSLNIGNLIFGTGLDGNGTTLASGNIGIGTTSPNYKLTVSGNSQFTGQIRIGDTFVGSMGNRNEKLAVTNYLTDPSISVYTSRVQASAGFTATNATKFNTAFLSNASVHNTNTADWTITGYPQLIGVSGGADATSGSSGTIERAAGVYSVISAAADSATLKQAAFFQGDAAGTNITHMVGAYLTGLGHGVYNTGLYLGIAQDALTPTSNFAIYDVTGYNSSLSGNLGIATTTPSARLSVTNLTDGNPAIQISGNSTSIVNTLRFADYSTFNNIFNVNLNGSATANTNLTNIPLTASLVAASGSTGGISIVTRATGAPIIFGAGGATSERMRITGDGNVGIGTTTPLQKLQVFGNIRVGTSGSNGCIEDYGGGVIGGTCSSDERLKDDIESLASSTPRSYLEALTTLTPVTYEWNEEASQRYGKSMNVANLGLIAQDVENVFPELVSRNSDGFRQVDFRALPFYLIEAVKELWMKVRGIDERVEDLEQENEYLKSRLDEIENELNVTPPPSPTLEPTPEAVPETPPEPEVNVEPEEVVEEPTYTLVPAAVPAE